MALGWLLLIAAAAHGYGIGVARLLKLDLPTRLERTVLTIGLGVGCLIVTGFVLGLLHRVGRGSSLLLILPAAAFGAWQLVTSPEREPAPTDEPRWIRLALLSALGACVLANVVATLAPPSFIDALVYHLYIARTYARAGGIVELPAIWQSYQPLGVEMLFTLGFSLQGATLAALMHMGLGILAAGATFVLGRRIAGSLAGLLAAAIFYCTAMIAWESTSCFVELGITTFNTLGFCALLHWSDDENPRWLVTVALLMGLAGTCKLTAIQFSFVAAALVGWISWRRGRGLVVALGRAATLVGISLGLCLPWYIHSYLWTGNPVYPFAAGVFGENVDHEGVWVILSHYGPGHGFKDLLLAPWRLFSSGALFECAQYLSPLPFVLGPLMLLRLRRADGDGSPAPSTRYRQIVFAAVVIAFVLWLKSAHIARYLVPLQPLLAVLAADALCWAAEGSRYRFRLMVVTAALFIGFGTASTVLGLRSVAPVVLGRESVDSYLTRTAVSYTTYRMVMADVPESGLILTNQAATFYLDRPHMRVHDAEFLHGAAPLSKVLATRPLYPHLGSGAGCDGGFGRGVGPSGKVALASRGRYAGQSDLRRNRENTRGSLRDRSLNAPQ